LLEKEGGAEHLRGSAAEVVVVLVVIVDLSSMGSAAAAVQGAAAQRRQRKAVAAAAQRRSAVVTSQGSAEERSGVFPCHCSSHSEITPFLRRRWRATCRCCATTDAEGVILYHPPRWLRVRVCSCIQ